ncbi:MAG: M20/M25/M40 family metallo-hydrolase [Coriobacteriales bacterium]|nr:M20/M25/M40 family metallo-hydrolase [Coriobacteriales bacterium]
MSVERLVKLFTELVRIDSPSLSEGDVAQAVARELEAAGCTVRFDDSMAQTGSDIGNLIAELPGTVDATLLLSAHLDTVEPGRGIEPVERDGVIYSAGETVLGADDKAGLAAAIESIRRIAESGAKRPTIRCVFTVGEELGLKGAKALDPDDGRADLCLVLDADGRPGGIVIAAPTHYTFVAEFYGRAAHAGVSPERGVSAIEMAADAVSAMELGRLDETTTANVGSVHGGSATNVVTAEVRLTGECRSLDRERVEQVKERMDSVMRKAADDRCGTVTIDWTLEYVGFVYSDDDPALALLKDAAQAAGLEPHTFRTGGGSDANIFAATGTPTFALGCGMQNVHSHEEHVAIDDLESMTRMIIAVSDRLAREG